MLKVKGLCKKYKRCVFKNFNYEFNKGINIIVGDSGKGKTTLLNILAGRDFDFEGKLYVEEEILYFKDKNNFPSNLTVNEVCGLFEKINNTEIRYYFDISNLRKKKIKRISLGEQQLVALNLFLNSTNKIIILDEPFTALSEENYNKAVSIIEKNMKDKTVIISSHRLNNFKNYKLLDLNNISKNRVKDFDNYCCNTKKHFKISYYLFYLKKNIFRKIIFFISLITMISSYNFIHNYCNNLIGSYLNDFSLNEGTIIEKKNEIKEMNDNLFYEVIKKISTYVTNYNANYYNSDLYKHDIVVNDLYIDNAFLFSSFKYVETLLMDDEIILGLNYRDFCEYNKIFNCTEDYIKTLLVNKKIDDFPFFINDVFESEESVVMINKKFYKLYGENDYVEYYFDINKESLNYVFSIINNDEFLLEFDFVKIGENDTSIRYNVEIDGKKNFLKNEQYDKYLICLEKGYNCLDYSKYFSTLISVDEKDDIAANLGFKVIDDILSLDEIIITNELSISLNKVKGDVISFYFDYDDVINKIDLKIKNVVDDEGVYIYHNNSWSYDFFEQKVGFNCDDLVIKNILIYDNLKEGYYKSEDIYELAIISVRNLLDNMKLIIIYINLMVHVFGTIILIFLENFGDKFKREYFEYLRILGVNKKCSK